MTVLKISKLEGFVSKTTQAWLNGKSCFLIQMLLTFGGRCNHYLWDIRLKIHRSPNFREQSLTIGGGGRGEGWYYFKSAGPKISAPLRLTAQNSCPLQICISKNCNPNRQTREKLQCLYENLVSNKFRKTGVPNENIVQNHLKNSIVERILVFKGYI